MKRQSRKKKEGNKKKEYFKFLRWSEAPRNRPAFGELELGSILSVRAGGWRQVRKFVGELSSCPIRSRTKFANAVASNSLSSSSSIITWFCKSLKVEFANWEQRMLRRVFECIFETQSKRTQKWTFFSKLENCITTFFFFLPLYSVIVATKLFEDTIYNNVHYAYVGGIPVAELNRLELDFLVLLDFDLHVTETVFDSYSIPFEKYFSSVRALSSTSDPSAPSLKKLEIEAHFFKHPIRRVKSTTDNRLCNETGLCPPRPRSFCVLQMSNWKTFFLPSRRSLFGTTNNEYVVVFNLCVYFTNLFFLFFLLTPLLHIHSFFPFSSK